METTAVYTSEQNCPEAFRAAQQRTMSANTAGEGDAQFSVLALPASPLWALAECVCLLQLKKSLFKSSACHCFCPSLPLYIPRPLLCSWRLHSPPLPTLVGRTGNKTQEGRGPLLLRDSSSPLCRLVPCCSPRTGLSKSRVIQMALALFRLSSPANFIPKSGTSPESFVLGGRLLRSVPAKLILASLSSRVARITSALIVEAFLLLIPKEKHREHGGRSLLLQAVMTRLLMGYQLVLRKLRGPRFFLQVSRTEATLYHR